MHESTAFHLFQLRPFLNSFNEDSHIIAPTGQGVERLLPKGMGSAKVFGGPHKSLSAQHYVDGGGGTFRHSFYIIVHKSHLVAF